MDSHTYIRPCVASQCSSSSSSMGENKLWEGSHWLLRRSQQTTATPRDTVRRGWSKRTRVSKDMPPKKLHPLLHKVTVLLRNGASYDTYLPVARKLMKLERDFMRHEVWSGEKAKLEITGRLLKFQQKYAAKKKN